MTFVRKFDKEKDLPVVSEWLANDPEHQALGITINDFLEDGTEIAMVYDDNGPLMAIRFHKALRAAVQFNPKTRLRNARVIKEVADWITELAKENDMKEVIVRPGPKPAKLIKNKCKFQDFNGMFREAI
jgi:anthranilate/para-aminobenzoate synthase component II